ncbi:enoyl-CoA hydratase/isomerase family protein [Actinophytocola gossypii]|uniref:Enoyl-CoA hydratase/isomerase family protein n=1 Tax=Actinophytocola gossypii TaxID=2812003 RepID=A0ABT2J1Y6_9PSEU|nr:enoyl-CoA hydratase-related protein [Actinophytocola gossypii]MCT2581867.1 enoyl-CoA hydratase/isomerase family protein [Actinophytocola gossypii]
MSGTEVGSGTVLFDLVDGVGTVTLNRPERRNAISWQLVEDLLAALDRAGSARGLRVLVVTGAGSDFCVGADLARVGSDHQGDQETRTLRGRSAEDDLARLTHASTIVELLTSFPRPTIAAVDGACAGAGLSLALAADFRIAAERAVFNTAFVSAGVSGDLGSAWLLTRAVGGARARALLLDPGKLTAARAADVGIVTEVVADLRTRVDELAGKLATQAPRAMRYAKQNLADAALAPLSDYLGREAPRMVDCARGADARLAARAFMEGRRPVFTEE